MNFDGAIIRGLPEIQAAMRDFSERRLAAAMATALTRTAGDAKAALKSALPQVFDRPNPYTMNSLYTRGATAARLAASVYFKDDIAASKGGTPATKYLLPEVDGGKRRSKRFEVALQAFGALPGGWVTVPAQGASIDAYGNMQTGQIIQILSQLRITMTAGHQRNMSFDARSQTAAQRKAGGRFYVVRPGDRSGAQPGIYQREMFGRNTTPVVIFVRAATYRKRFDFWGIGRQVAAEQLPIRAREAVRDQMARLIAKQSGGTT